MSNVSHDSRHSRCRLAFLVLSAAILMVSSFTSLLFSQTFYGSIVGMVVDPSGGVIAGATVTLTNTGTSERRSATSDPTGSYRFVNLIPGPYRIEVEMTGFKRFVREPITVEVQSAVRIDVPMQIGSISEIIEVTGQTPLLQTETTTLGQVVERQMVQDMPLNGRNVFNLSALVPGVVPGGQSMANPSMVNNTGTNNYQIGGGMANANASYLDGAPLNINYSNTAAIVPAQDMVQEFRVQTNNLSAEFGRFAGGVINLTTKSGSNAFHGSAYEFLRNKVLNANTFFANKNGVPRSPYTQNQFGATLGGPVIKDKTYFFVGYEGFRFRTAAVNLSTVPTADMRAGDFSNLRDTKGNLILIYDPLTVCGRLGNDPCPRDSKGAEIITRQPFANNRIPANRISPTSKALMNYYPLPNIPGDKYTYLNNWTKNVSTGTSSEQYNARIDQNLSDKQRIFGRWTYYKWWRSAGSDAFQTGVGGKLHMAAHSVVLADTYTLSPTSVFDIRVAAIRYSYENKPITTDLDLTTLGWPAGYNNQVMSHSIPVIAISTFTGFGNITIFDRNNSYSIVPSLTKMLGGHTIKVGGEARWLQFNFLQADNPTGTFSFTNGFTAQNPTVASGGYSFASFLLGNGTGSTLQPSFTAGQQVYQGYFVTDTFQATKKLTVNYGLRWELPFPYTERFDRLTTFLPNAVSPLAQATGLPLKGKVALVNSPDRQDRHNQDPHWKLFAPRVGLAYRLNDKTVVRSAMGVFYWPNDIVFQLSPNFSPANTVTSTWASTLDGGISPSNITFSNPWPTGINQPPGHSSGYEQLTFGQNAGSPIADDPYAYSLQWNLTVQRELGPGFALELAYAGSRGVHLPSPGQEYNQLPNQYLSMGADLQKQVKNPFYGLVTSGTLAAATVAQGQLLRPYPQYSSVSVRAANNRDSVYHSMQVKVEKRFRAGGVLLGAYTWSKLITNTENASSWLETNDVGSGGTGGIQNNNNLRAERSVSSQDAPHRLVASYVFDLPMGTGKRFLGGASGVFGKLVSGWGINGVSTFQSGYPMNFTTSQNLTSSFGGGSRPNLVPGCNPRIDGPAQSRLTGWFNTACFQAPPAYTFGNVSRTFSGIRQSAINNWDFALFKRTKVTEAASLEFRAEVFNLANRVRFGFPGQVVGLATFGQVSAQNNNPRLMQFALRLSF